jgi:hypothetical protein
LAAIRPYGAKQIRSPGLFSVRPSGDWNTHKKMSKLYGTAEPFG